MAIAPLPTGESWAGVESALAHATVDLVDAPAASGSLAIVLDDLETVRVTAAIARAVVVVTRELDRSAATRWLEAGASGLVLAVDAERTLLPTMTAVAAGLVVVPRDARRVMHQPVFTARQKQILSLVVLGLRNADIAAKLFVTEATVKSHLTGIFAKLGVSSRSEAVHAVTDPASGLGTGILAIADEGATQEGYGAPQIT